MVLGISNKCFCKIGKGMDMENYKNKIFDLIEEIDNEEKMISIYNLLYTIKDIKNIRIIEFLINVSNSFKEKWGI